MRSIGSAGTAHETFDMQHATRRGGTARSDALRCALRWVIPPMQSTTQRLDSSVAIHDSARCAVARQDRRASVAVHACDAYALEPWALPSSCRRSLLSVDDLVSSFVASLEALHVADDTYFIFTSDHVTHRERSPWDTH